MTPIIEKSIGIDGQVFAERRAQLRQRVFKGGSISFNGGYGAMDCVVRNLSANGAKLVFGDGYAVPARFSLRISGEASREAEVCWRNLREIGIRIG